MDLRYLSLWAVVQYLSAVVNAANSQDCPALEIQNGYFVSEQNPLSQDTQVYYACDEGFMPVEGGWWATLTCQNGQWSSTPQCIENTSCFDPKIENGIYSKFTYKKNNTKLWVKCKPGYEDKTKDAVALCLNGVWKDKPVCERSDTSCGPPPQIPNAVIINKDYSDIFPQEAEVFYVCQAGFELHTDTNKSVCTYGQWNPRPSCREKQTQPVSGGKGAPIPSGSEESHDHLISTIDRCGPVPTVNFGDFTINQGRTVVSYKCGYWYKLKGNRIVKCFNGQWTRPPTCEVDYCKLDTSGHEYLNNVGNVFIKRGTKVTLHCPGRFDTAYARCIDNQLYVSKCCWSTTHAFDLCHYHQIPQ